MDASIAAQALTADLNDGPINIEVEPTDTDEDRGGGVLAGLLRQYRNAREIPLPKTAKGATGKVEDLTAAQRKAAVSQFSALVNFAIGAAMGPEAKLTNDEHSLIVAPLEKMLADFPFLGIVVRYVGPVSIAVGLFLWRSRLQRQKAMIAAARAQTEAAEMQAKRARDLAYGSDQHFAVG